VCRAWGAGAVQAMQAAKAVTYVHQGWGRSSAGSDLQSSDAQASAVMCERRRQAL